MAGRWTRASANGVLAGADTGRGLLLAPVVAALMLIPLFGFTASIVQAAEPAVTIPPPAVDQAAPAGSGLQTAVLAGGCFWGVQGVYEHTKGVTQAVSGYAGGQKDTAHYEEVGTGRTGHAESVSVTFDPQQISYGKILQIYFSVAHNPTELNRQGPDVGTQYRSVIFYTTPSQERAATESCAARDAGGFHRRPIVTSIEPAPKFYEAEDYHQRYLEKRGLASCHL